MSESRSNHFPLLTEAETKVLLAENLNSPIKELVRNLTKILDSWVVENWYKTHSNNKLFHRYLTVAFKLKKPIQGEVEILPTQDSNSKPKKKFSFTYQEFWQDCYEKLILSFLVRLSKRYGDELKDAKLHMCALMQFKEYVIPQLDLEEKHILNLQATIDKLVFIYSQRASQQDAYCLSPAEVNQAKEMKDYFDIGLAYHRLRDLKNAFEESPIYARYCHIRPGILIQFAEAINSVCCDIETTINKSKSYFFSNENIVSQLTPILKILEKKRSEIIEVMIFQEKLLLTFGFDDLIEILQDLIQNKDGTLLPPKAFFMSDEDSVSSYEIMLDHSKKITPIAKKNYSAWRREYIQHHGNSELIQNISPIKLDELNSWLDKRARKNACIKQSQWIPLNDTPKVIPTENTFEIIAVPSIVAAEIFRVKSSDLSQLSAPSSMGFFKKEPPSHHYASQVTAYDFFINQFNFRKEFYNLNTYIHVIESLQKQIDSRENFKIHFIWVTDPAMAKQAIFSKNNRPYLLTEETETNFNTLISILHLLNIELRRAELCLQNSISADRKAMQLYVTFINEKIKTLHDQVNKIAKYWIDQVKDVSVNNFPPIRLFNQLLKDLVVKSQNKEILDYFNMNIAKNTILEEQESKSLLSFYEMKVMFR